MFTLNNSHANNRFVIFFFSFFFFLLQIFFYHYNFNLLSVLRTRDCIKKWIIFGFHVKTLALCLGLEVKRFSIDELVLLFYIKLMFVLIHFTCGLIIKVGRLSAAIGYGFPMFEDWTWEPSPQKQMLHIKVSPTFYSHGN